MPHMRERVVMFAGLVLLLSASLLLAQSREKSEFEKCFGYPTLADEIRQMTGEPSEEAGVDMSGQTLDVSDGIQIGDIRFSGAIRASASERGAIAAELMKQPADFQLQEFTERARDAWQQQGYFKAVLSEPKIVSVKKKGDEATISATIHVEEGPRYTFKDVAWQRASAYSPEELTPLMPLRRGDIFNTERVRQGLQALREAYGRKGYINFTAVPDTLIDESTHEITLVIDLDEGTQFRVGDVILVTRPTDDEMPVVEAIMQKARALIGQPYDSLRVEQIFEGTRFPPDQTIEVQQNNEAATVDILFTSGARFRCPADPAD